MLMLKRKWRTNLRSPNQENDRKPKSITFVLHLLIWVIKFSEKYKMQMENTSSTHKQQINTEVELPSPCAHPSVNGRQLPQHFQEVFQACS